MIIRYILAALLATLLSACATTAITKSTSTPVLNRDGTITMDVNGNYPREIIIEVKAKARFGELEQWMLDTNISRTGNDITFHTGNVGSGMKGVDTEALIQMIIGSQALMMRYLSDGLISPSTP